MLILSHKAHIFLKTIHSYLFSSIVELILPVLLSFVNTLLFFLTLNCPLCLFDFLCPSLSVSLSLSLCLSLYIYIYVYIYTYIHICTHTLIKSMFTFVVRNYYICTYSTLTQTTVW